MGIIRAFLRGRFLSFAMILGIGFLLLVSLVLSAALAAMSDYLSKLLPILAGMVSLLDFIISFVGITAIFAFMFKFLPAAILKWKDVWVGAAVTSLLFSIGKLLIGLYLEWCHRLNIRRSELACHHHAVGRTILHKSSSLELNSLACMQ
jgi:membrane protein